MATRKVTGRKNSTGKWPQWEAKVRKINSVDAKLAAAIKALQKAQQALRDVTAKPPGGGPNMLT